MAEHPAQYKWSSYHANAQNCDHEFIEEHPVYSRFCVTREWRQAAYRELFRIHINGETLQIMTTQAKYLLLIPAILLLAVALLLFRLPDIATFIVERELRAAGFTDIVLDIKAITISQSKINILHANHPEFTLDINDATLDYTLTQLLDKRIEKFEIAKLQLTLHDQQGKPGITALPTMPVSWLSAFPFNHGHIRRAQLNLSKVVNGISELDLQGTITRRARSLEALVTINTGERAPLLLQLTASDDNSFKFTLKDTAPVLTLHGRELAVAHDKLSTELEIKVDIEALRLLIAQWLPEQAMPNLFDTLSGKGKLEFMVTDKQLRADLDVTLTGVEQVLHGPVLLIYQPGQLALVLKESFDIQTRNKIIAKASLPQLQLAVKDDIKCTYLLTQTRWQCAAGRVALTLPELHYPPYTMRSKPGMVTLHNISGKGDAWLANVDIDLPAVSLVLPDNVMRFDRVLTQLHTSSEELKATAKLRAADGQLAIGIKASHNMQQQSGKAEVRLQPVSLNETHNIPGKLLDRWPYPVHIDSGELDAESSITWQQKNRRLSFDQTTVVQMNNIQGQFQQYPFTGLRGKLFVKGVDTLRITSSDGIRMASINLGVPVIDLFVRAGVSRLAGKTFVTSVQNFEATTLGGKISTGATVIDLNKDENQVNLDVNGLDIAELIKLEQKKGLIGTGKLTGKLPIIFGKHGLSMSAGKLSAQPPYGIIQYSTDEKMTALAKNNPNVELLLNALSDFRYNLLEADFDYAPDGQLLAKVRLQGNNPELEGGRPVHLNITLEENIPTLLRSLQFAEDISRKVGESIEQGVGSP